MGITKQVRPDGATLLAESNGHIVENEKEARNEIIGSRLGILDGEESGTNGATEGPRNKESSTDDLILAQRIGPQIKQQQLEQSVGPIIRWERFLPVRTLKVLLVEYDDSTRQVVSALLRNCSYEVTAVANGLQAWKILEDLTNHIDLVLTEVVMPCLSGIGLLDKIMNHKSCKNIPVIMMSSNDSMGTVFKCLSKGAVDFLVKPIRKNELKNLWQHVWRRCHSSSGSGSESGIQTQNSVKSKSTEDSDNNSDSNDDDNENSRLNARDGSDNGSGTQSSWTKRAVEIESPQHDQLADPPDSTCAQVIHPKPETFWSDWVPTGANRECQGQKELDDDFMGKDLEIGVPKNMDKRFDSYQAERTSKLTDTKIHILLDKDEKDESAIERKNTSDEQRTQAADLIGAIANTPDIQSVTRTNQAPNGFLKIQEGQEKITHDSVELPSLELSLKRLRSTTDGGTDTHEDRNVLRRSDQSAFTRYHSSVASNQAPTGNGGSCSPFESSSEAMRAESTYNMVSTSNAVPLKQGSYSNSILNDMGSTTKNVLANPSTYKEKASTSIVKCMQNVSAFQPVQNHASTSQQLVQEKTEDEKAARARGQSRGQHQVQVQHRHHHYHHHHLHVHNMMQQQQQQQQQPQSDHDGSSVKNMAAVVVQCGSSDVFVGQVEGKTTNSSIYGSNSGSNHGSNGHNGSSSAVKVGELNVDSVNGIADQYGPGGENGSGSGSGSGSGGGIVQHRFTQREAALKKFRQKRKERNFGKKVRYQSRQRLAEQRPRMRGQFVRQVAREDTDPRKQRDDNNDGSHEYTCVNNDS